MNITQIEEIVKKLVNDVYAGKVDKDEFIYELMAAYGHRKTTIGRIKSGERNLADIAGEVRAKRHVYFKHCQGNNVLSDIDSMKKQPSVAREKIRFVIATDFNQFVALDTRTNDTLDIEFNDLGKHFDFFLPWAGMEKAVYQGENPADVKAAEKMAKLFDLIKADNFNDDNKHDKQALHNLNVFLTRLLFCFFAEDTGIFKQNQFSGELESHTKVDGSDVADYLNRFFEVLNTPKNKRADLPDYLANFEFVNGGLFADNIASPRFSTKSRKMLIECGSELDWSDINPDIFGSMIQAVVHPDQRGGMGMHYTSVTNIMKVIEPLFLDELYAELENIEDNIDPKLKPSRLRKLHDRISSLKIFDPACGSGNFLIIAFKELRKLEMEIIKRLQEIDKNDNQDDLFGDVGLDSSFSQIKLSQFYGIELDDFAHEVAILSLWLAEHQMNVEFKAEFGECNATLPLSVNKNIVCGNACLIDWEQVCPNKDSEVFLCGNPPYVGQRNHEPSHIQDMKVVFSEYDNFKNLDYISCWFMKAGDYISENDVFSFVTTNSINQGSQVEMLWPKLYEKGLEIIFAYEFFKWKNNAKENAGVTCSIIGLSKVGYGRDKYIYKNGLKVKVVSINSYLTDGPATIVSSKKNSISNLPTMIGGNQPREGGFLCLTDNEKLELVSSYPESMTFIKKLVGTNELIKDIPRWCIWIEPEQVQQALEIEPIRRRVEQVKEKRENGNSVERNFVNMPYRFVQVNKSKNSQIVIPNVSTPRRKYIPIGYLDSESIITNLAMMIPDAGLFTFGLVTSHMHMVWSKAVAGRLGDAIRYTVGLCYNTFPVPEVTKTQIDEVEKLSLEVLSTRELYPEHSLDFLYNPDTMPEKLVIAHKNLDLFIESLYKHTPFKDDLERLAHLLALFENMTGGQNA